MKIHVLLRHKLNVVHSEFILKCLVIDKPRINISATCTRDGSDEQLDIVVVHFRFQELKYLLTRAQAEQGEKIYDH